MYGTTAIMEFYKIKQGQNTKNCAMKSDYNSNGFNIRRAAIKATVLNRKFRYSEHLPLKNTEEMYLKKGET